MKKKFINGLLMAALFLGFTGSVVSCKDYDDEKYKDLQGQLSDAQTSLRVALDKQAQQIAELTTSLNECKSTCADFRNTVNQKFNDYLTLVAFNAFKGDIESKLANFYTKSEIDQKFSGLDDKYYTKTQVDNLLAALEAKLADYYTKTEADARFYTKTEIDNLLTEKLGNYYTKEEVDNKLQEYLKTNAVAQTIADLLNAGDATLTGALNTFFVNDPVVVEYLENGKGSDIIKKHITEALISVNDSIKKASAVANQALSLANANKIEIDSLKDVTTTLNNNIISLGERVDTVSAKANQALALAMVNSLLIINLGESMADLVDLVGELADGIDLLADGIDLLADDLDKLADKVDEELEKADELHRQMLETISGLAEALDGQDETIGDLQTSLDEKVDTEEYNFKIDEIETNIQNANDDITKTNNQLAKYYGFFENVVAKFITGIELNGSFNSAFGELSLPVGIRSNVLVAFYGKLDDYGVQFPTARPAYYALPANSQWEKITDEDIQMLGDLSQIEGYLDGKNGNKDIVAMDGAEGNAGTLYVTVNPTNRDFNDTEFTLINSRNEESSFLLSPLRSSDHLVSFGYTRAGVASQSPNGFYETKATISAEEATKNTRNKLSFDFDGIVDVLKDVKNYQDGISVTNLFNTLYNALPTLEADALKVTWEDSLGIRSVISPYEIAAAAVKPLSFAFLKDVNIDGIIPSTPIENVVDMIVEAVMEEVPEFNIPDYVVEGAEIVGTTDDGFYLMQVTVSKDNGTSKAIVEVKVNKGNEQKWNDNIDDIMDLVNEYVDKLNKLNVDNVTDKANVSINGYIDAINKRFARFLTPNKYLQPVLLIKANGNYGRLSEAHSYPARVNKTELALVPTTYNAEVLAPAYKKFIAVTNVSKGAVSAKGGDAACKKVLDDANKQNDLKKVIDGGFTTINFQAVKGYTYEFLYSAVDYAGKVATKKFYVTVNE